MKNNLAKNIGKDNEEISRQACEFFWQSTETFIKKKGFVNIVFPAGSSPVRFYEILSTEYKDKVKWDKIRAFGLDELANVEKKHRASFYTFIKEKLFNNVSINTDNIYFLNGGSSNLISEITKFESRIKEMGGIDISILGVGPDGHIGMNFPDVSIESSTRIVRLPQFARPKKELFDADEKVAAYGITLGIKNIMDSQVVMLIADGENKREAISKLDQLVNDPHWPLTYLNSHKQAHFFLTEKVVSKAAMKINKIN